MDTNKKIILILGAIVVLAAAGWVVWKFNLFGEKEAAVQGVVFEPKNGTYLFDNKPIALKDGYAEAEVFPGSASKEIVRYFGNDVRADFDNDGQEDATFLLTREAGGSGTFFYVAVLLGDGQAGIGTVALPIGDRIAPQTTEFKNGMIIVNYADRKPDEPFTVEPSVGMTRYFKVVDKVFFEVTPALSESEAKTIAEKTCIKSGEALSAGSYNEITKTWWFDANLNITGEGCNPACVVSEETKTAEINWRCTGLIPLDQNNPNTPPASNQCGIENCHGLDIVCGPNPAKICTMEYRIGDICRQYAQCGVANSTCQIIENSKFVACKVCVKKCENDLANTPDKILDCEQKCAD